MNISNPIYIGLIVIMQLCFYALSILLHEFGHWIYFKRRNIPTKTFFKFHGGFEIHAEGLSKEEHKDSLLAGIFFGIVPLIVAIFYNFFFLWLFIPYLYGCSWDIREYKKIDEERQEELKKKGIIEM